MRVLLAEGLIDAGVLLERVAATELVPELRDRIERWIRMTAAELD